MVRGQSQVAVSSWQKPHHPMLCARACPSYISSTLVHIIICTQSGIYVYATRSSVSKEVVKKCLDNYQVRGIRFKPL